MRSNDRPLESAVGVRKTNQQKDVKLIQAALSVLKIRRLKKYYDDRIDGRFGDKSLGALTQFQQDQRIKCDGVVTNNSPCLRRISQELEKAVLKQSRPAKLTFDGKKLCWVGFPHNRKCWRGVSGRQGFQTREHQMTKDVGPLPEGKWRVRQDRYQRYNEIPIWTWAKTLIGRGVWRGGTASWGRNRIWLEPLAGTNTFGRIGLFPKNNQVPGCAELERFAL